MRKNRDRLSLVATILETANSGANKTKIMFMANLSFKLLEKYLALSLSAGFLKQNGSLFETTEKGRHFLKSYSHFRDRKCRVQKILLDISEERKLLEHQFQTLKNDSPKQIY